MSRWARVRGWLAKVGKVAGVVAAVLEGLQPKVEPPPPSSKPNE